MAIKIRTEERIEGIKIGNGVLKLLQYADDTSGMLKDVNSAKVFLQIVHKFGEYSGLCLNRDKTEAMWLGSCRNNTVKPLGILWPVRPLRVLGVYVSYNDEANYTLNFEEKIEKAKRILDMWKMRKLTLYGKAQIIKTFIVSQFLYVSSAIETPQKAIKTIDRLIFKFIWGNKIDRIKRSVLKSEVCNGGIKVPDFDTMLKTSRYKWIKRLEKTEEPPWKVILRCYLKKYGISLEVLLHSNYSLKTLGLEAHMLPMFYYELLKLWSNTGNTTGVDKSEFIWYNRELCIKGRSVFYPDFLQCGIWYVSDLYCSDGEVIPFDVWVNRGLSRTNLIRWMSLVRKTKRKARNTLSQLDLENIGKLSLLGKGPLYAINSPVIYKELLREKLGESVHVPRISKYLADTESTDWCKVYERANKIPIDTKIKDFQYRFIHDILSNNYWLNKWKIKDTSVCTYCSDSVEDIAHMFWYCEKSREFWDGVANLLQLHVNDGQNGFTMEDVFFGSPKDRNMCQIIFSAKCFYTIRECMKNQ